MADFLRYIVFVEKFPLLVRFCRHLGYLARSPGVRSHEVVSPRGAVFFYSADLRHPRGGEAQGSLPDAVPPHHYQYSFELRLYLRLLQCVQRGAVLDGQCRLFASCMLITTWMK